MLSLDNHALALSIASAFLAGCAGSQPPISATGAMQQSNAIAMHADRGGSWMLPEAKTASLIYATDNESTVYVFSYATGSVIGELEGLPGPAGECTDKSGNIYITARKAQEILEYAPGGTEPIATLSDPGYIPMSCGIDPKTGNLAVSNTRTASYGVPGSVAIYAHAQGNPTLYSDPAISAYYFCGYDSQGNLFINGQKIGSPSTFTFAELPKGRSSFTNVALNLSNFFPGSIQWDGKYITLANSDASLIDRITVSGSSGTVVGQTSLNQIESGQQVQSATRGGRVIVPYGTRAGHGVAKIGFWRYPRGGNHLHNIEHFGADALFGLTISK